LRGLPRASGPLPCDTSTRCNSKHPTETYYMCDASRTPARKHLARSETSRNTKFGRACYSVFIVNISIEELRRKARARLYLKITGQGLRKAPSKAWIQTCTNPNSRLPIPETFQIMRKPTCTVSNRKKCARNATTISA
jgi:hypothetical protein